MKSGLPNVFVVHVKVGFEDRLAFIDEQLRQRGISYELMLAHDIPDLTAADRARFTGPMREERMLPAVSCALKHFAIYEAIVSRGLPGALVLEDDICLAAEFTDVFNRALSEAKRRPEIDDQRLLVCFENPMLQFTPRSQRQSGQLLYQVPRSHGTGCYYVARDAAQALLDQFRSAPVHEPIDHFQASLASAGQIAAYWCQPAVAEQGSTNGKFTSAVEPRRRAGLRRKASWAFDRLWKRLVSEFR